MREGWTYKKLGEVCRINSGKSIKACEILDDQQEGFVPCYGGNGIRGYVKSVSHTGTYPIVGRVGALCGNVHLATGSFYATEHALVFTCENQNVDKRWLARYLESQSLGKYAKGVAQPVIAAGELSKLCIHIPPLYVQDAIVSELDEINSLLALKREQLQKYDKLAQSLFYEMFGDPVENEKGWEAKELNKCVEEMFLGPFGSALKVECYVPEDKAYAMVYEQKHAIQGRLDLEKHFISKEKFDSLSRFEVLPGDFIMSCRGTIGKIYQLPNNASRGIIHPSLMKIRIKGDVYSSMYFIFMLRKIVANETTNGNCVQMAITAKELGRKQLPLPPLPLQQQFASRIEQIESQKLQVQAAIEKLETLLVSRMQYWFE